MVLGLVMVANLAMVANGDDDDKILTKKVKGKRVCTHGWECTVWSSYCCNQTISQIFQVYQFEDLFSKRNSPVAKAVGFWDYKSFITATALFQHLGFGTTGGKVMQMKEIAAFLGHVGAKTSCKREHSLLFNLGFGFCLVAEKIFRKEERNEIWESGSSLEFGLVGL